MKSFKKISVITLLTVSLFFSANLIIQAATNPDKPPQTQNALQQANNLFIEGSSTFNNELILQAKDKLSQWLKENQQNADKATLAEALRTRASISIALNNITDAITDFKKANHYAPIAEVQLAICFLESKQTIAAADLPTCYAQAVQMFTAQQTAKTDVNYLLARILSGDKKAITEFKQYIETAEDNQQLIYKLAAQQYLDQATYKQIIME